VTAATTAAGLRFRAVMMTSFAFILGLVPLVIASGAGAATQRAVGTAVFGGMIAASFLGVFVIPPLYVTFQGLRERLRPTSRPHPQPDPMLPPATDTAAAHRGTAAE
jgi:Cu/Ag efflux pump CusA